MPSIDTSNWLPTRNFWSNTNATINEFAANTPNGWTLGETDNGRNISSTSTGRTWRMGFPVHSRAPLSSNILGKATRPPQRLTYTVPGSTRDVHFIPTIRYVHGPTTSVVSGQDVLIRSTNVGQFQIATYAVSAHQDIDWENPNDAQVQMQVVVWDASESANWAKFVLNLSTLNIPDNNDRLEDFGNWVTRSTIGSAYYYLGTITHNANPSSKSGAWSGAYNLFGLQTLAAHQPSTYPKFVVAYRLVNATQPFYVPNSAIGSFGSSHILGLNAGIYSASPPPIQYRVEFAANLNLGASVVVNVESDRTQHVVQPVDRVRLRESVMYEVAITHRVNVGGRVYLSAAGATLSEGASVRIERDIQFDFDLTTRIGRAAFHEFEASAEFPTTMVIHHRNAEGEIVDVDGGDGGGYLLTAGRRLWKALGFPG